MIKINLLPVKAAKKKERAMNQVFVGILVVIFALAGIGYRYYSQKSQIQTVKDEIVATDKKIAKLKEAKKKFEQLQAKKKMLDQQISAIEKLDRGRDWFIRVLDKISESVPHNQVWLTQVKFGGKKGRGGGSPNAINLRGKSYDRDAVAYYMGNLSIVPCDDELPDLEKAPVCQLRNERCRSYNEEKGNWEWDFESCRKFYKDTCDEANSCKEDVNICNSDKRNACATEPRSKGCLAAKEKCVGLEAQCKDAQADCTKLREEEYVKYDSIKLNYVQTGSGKRASTPVFDFEIVCSMTNPPSK